MIIKTFNGVKNLLLGLGVTFKNLFSKPVTFSLPGRKKDYAGTLSGSAFLEP